MGNVVLIRPPMVLSQYSLSTSATPPLAIAYLSGFLRSSGFDPQAIDALGEGLDTYTPVEGTVGLAQGLPIDYLQCRRYSPPFIYRIFSYIVLMIRKSYRMYDLRFCNEGFTG